MSELLTKNISVREKKITRLTFDQFCDVLDENMKAHLIDGVMIMESPASDIHENLFGFLYFLLRGYVSKKAIGFIRGSRTLVRFSTEEAFEPDLAFIRKENSKKIKEQYIDGAPDLVVEIVSPGSRRLDRVEKKNRYAEYDVQEYWLIDPYEQTAEFFYLHEGEWQELPVDARGVFVSRVVSGFWLRRDWLFAEELPDELEALQLILTTQMPVTP